MIAEEKLWVMYDAGCDTYFMRSIAPDRRTAVERWAQLPDADLHLDAEPVRVRVRVEPTPENPPEIVG